MATTSLARFETEHQDTVHDAQFDYYGKQIATCSSDRMVHVFSVSGNQVSAWAMMTRSRGIPVGIPQQGWIGDQDGRRGIRRLEYYLY